MHYREFNPGGGNPGTRYFSNPRKPGFVCRQKPAFDELNFGCQYCTEKHIETEKVKVAQRVAVFTFHPKGCEGNCGPGGK